MASESVGEKIHECVCMHALLSTEDNIEFQQLFVLTKIMLFAICMYL